MFTTMGSLVLLATLAQAPAGGVQAPAAAPVQAQTTSPSAGAEDELGQKLLRIRRLYVEPFGDDAISKQVHGMVIASLTESKRFIITENKARADAVLKGVALEKTSQELHSYSEGTAAGGVGGSFSGGTGGIAGAAAAIDDSSTSTETIDHARVAIRLVDADGDVIWATTQESKGAKYKGASADVAEKAIKQLLRDIDKQVKKMSPVTPAAPK